MSQYAQPSDLSSYLNPIGLTNITTPVQITQLQNASALMDSYFNGRYGNGMPLVTWDASVVLNCCRIATWLIMSASRGYNPDNPGDVVIRQGYDDGIAWCNGVQRQAIHPTVTLTGTPTNNALPVVLTQPQRGWGTMGGVGTNTAWLPPWRIG